jgi:EpsI family protein
VALALVLLGTSAGARAWQARRVDQALRAGRVAPFPLASIPKILGDWEGRDEALDPQIARTTGSTDVVTRVYVHRRTGTRLEALLLYGPSTEMKVHTPENCYAAAGFTQPSGAEARTVKVKGGSAWPFHALICTKGEGGQADTEEVYYTWRYEGQWTPGLVTQKRFERIPGMLKIQLGRRLQTGEAAIVGNPCEDFLAHLMPELDRRLAASAAKAR